MSEGRGPAPPRKRFGGALAAGLQGWCSMKRFAMLLLLCACGAAEVTTLAGMRAPIAPQDEYGVCVARTLGAAGSASLGQQLHGAWRGTQGDEVFVLEFFSTGIVTHTDVKRDKRYQGYWSVRGTLLRLQFGDPDSAADSNVKIENGVMTLDYYAAATFEPVTCTD